MEITQEIKESLKGNNKLSNITVDELNDIINVDYKGESYRVILEKVD